MVTMTEIPKLSSKLTDRLIATCPLGSADRGTAMSKTTGARLSEREIQAPAAAAAARAGAYAFVANGAQPQTKHFMWALRGPHPWSDPA